MSTVFWWCITGSAIAGSALVARMRREGFYFWIVADVALVTRYVVARDWPQTGLWGIYLILAVYGLITWIQKEREKE